MTKRILFVDDEPNVLSGLTRVLRKEFEFDTALGGAEALALMQENLYAVVVSDMRMPRMSGEEFLAKAHVDQPDAVQMILSGQANLESTVVAVNNGSIFRFLIKPVDRDILVSNLNKALHQFNMVNAERELLQDTLSGAVAALTEVLSMVSPIASRRTTQVVEIVRHVSGEVGLGADWQLQIAAMMSGIGFAAIPADVVSKVTLGQELSDVEQRMADRYPEVTSQLLGRIPRLEGVSGILCARAGGLRVPSGLERQVELIDLAITIAEGLVRGQDLSALISVVRSSNKFDQAMTDALVTMRASSSERVESMPLNSLITRMTLRQDVLTKGGVMLASSGTVITESLLERVRNFAASVGVVDPILVSIPVERELI